jgi:hypothetical protein
MSVPAGDYVSKIQFRGRDVPAQTVELKLRVSPVKPEPKQTVLIDGYTNPHEGEAYLRDFVGHGMNVWRSMMTRADMQKLIREGTSEELIRWLETPSK